MAKWNPEILHIKEAMRKPEVGIAKFRFASKRGKPYTGVKLTIANDPIVYRCRTEVAVACKAAFAEASYGGVVELWMVPLDELEVNKRDQIKKGVME